MPNWCSNKIKVTHDDSNEGKQQLAQFKLKVQTVVEGGGIFSNFFPCPADLQELDANGKQYTWYEWQIEHWGTKWDVNLDIVTFENTDDSLEFWFDTAWSPPTAFLESVSKEFPDLEFFNAYSEQGASYAGDETFVNGDKIEQFEISPQFDDEGEPVGEYSDFLEEHGLHPGG
jgi:hypothetical protein